MQITLQNIGLIKNSTIKIDGLTVITGTNGTGKSTVGKVLFSLFDAVYDIKGKQKREINFYIIGELSKIFQNDRFVSTLSIIAHIQPDSFGEKYPTLNDYLGGLRSFFGNNVDVESYVQKLKEDVEQFNLSWFNQSDFNLDLINRMNKSDNNLSLEELVNNWKSEISSRLDLVLNDVEKNKDSDYYIRMKISQILKHEFSNQIQNFTTNKDSHIVMSDINGEIFNCQFVSNQLISNNCYSYISSKKAILVDDAYVIDNVRKGENLIEGSLHNQRIKNFLCNPSETNTFEQILRDDKYSAVKSLFDEVMPGSLDIENDGLKYVIGSHKLHANNLATGAKMFAIMKMLFLANEFTDGTILILDEPEAHLHPDWQNKFAQLVTLLVKETGVTVLLTTHSINFVMALDAYMRKYEINGKCNFYHAKLNKESMAVHENVNDDLTKIYDDLSESFSQMLHMRDFYLEDEGFEREKGNDD